MTDRDVCIKAANHWENLAADCLSMDKWNRDLGIELSRPGESPNENKAKLYRSVAKSLVLQAETGKRHCPCHLLEYEKCPDRPKA